MQRSHCRRRCVGALGDRHAQRAGVEADLGNETRCAGGGLSDGAPQGLAVTDQGFDRVRDARLGGHPLLLQVLKALHIQLSQQQAEG